MKPSAQKFSRMSLPEPREDTRGLITPHFPWSFHLFPVYAQQDTASHRLLDWLNIAWTSEAFVITPSFLKMLLLYNCDCIPFLFKQILVRLQPLFCLRIDAVFAPSTLIQLPMIALTILEDSCICNSQNMGYCYSTWELKVPQILRSNF